MDGQSAMTLLLKARAILMRVSSLLREGRIEESIKAIHYGLAVYGKHGNALMSGGRKEFEQLFDKALYLINLDQIVKKAANVALIYVPGKEAEAIQKLKILLELIRIYKIRDKEEKEHDRIQLKMDTFDKGKRLVESRCFDGAIQIFQRLSKECFDDAILHADIGCLLFDVNHVECITFFERAVQLDPKDHVSYALMGVAFRKIKRFDEARDAYLAALAIEQDNVSYLFNISRVHMDSGDWSDAQHYLRRVLEIDPSQRLAQKALAYASKHMRDMV